MMQNKTSLSSVPLALDLKMKYVSKLLKNYAQRAWKWTKEEMYSQI